MIIALKIVLLLVVVISLMGVIGEDKDSQLRNHLTAICITSIIGTIVTYVLL